jgi:nucleoside-diphosphate-sugar epimerase
VKGPKGKLIHISGAGNFIDFGTSGNFNPESKDWNDASEEDIRSVHKDMFNGQSDVLVLEAGAEAAVDTYIVCPSVVYGGASISASTAGIGYSIIAGNAKSLGYVPYIGNGTAVISTVSLSWNPRSLFERLSLYSTPPQIHILDLIDFLVKITDLTAAGPAQGTAYSRYYLLETARVQWKDLAAELANAMHAKGFFSSPEAKQVTFEQAGEGRHLVGANLLIKGDRAAALGFQPKGENILTQIHADLAEVPI